MDIIELLLAAADAHDIACGGKTNPNSLERLAAREIGELRAARYSYARLLPVSKQGEPDVGGIHQNIRNLLTELGKCRQDAARWRAVRWCAARKIDPDYTGTCESEDVRELVADYDKVGDSCIEKMEKSTFKIYGTLYELPPELEERAIQLLLDVEYSSAEDFDEAMRQITVFIKTIQPFRVQ